MTSPRQHAISAKAGFVRVAREVTRSGRSQNVRSFLLMPGGKA